MKRIDLAEDVQIFVGDCRDALKSLPANSVHCCVTSPPYMGLRDYGLPPSVWGGRKDCGHDWDGGEGYVGHRGNRGQVPQTKWKTNQTYPQHTGTAASAFCTICGAWLGCLGLEPTVGLYVDHIVEVFREVRRVLRDDGTLWINLGDSYNGSGGSGGDYGPGGLKEGQPKFPGRKMAGLKPKDLVGVPWRCALALQTDGWWLRSEITWCKTAAMPESVTDRPASATEKIFLLSKSAQYFYDMDSVREPAQEWVGSAATFKRENSMRGQVLVPGQGHGTHRPDRDDTVPNPLGRNLRNYWVLGPEPTQFAHFATFPTEIPRRAILAGTSAHGCCRHCGAPWKRVVEKSYYGNKAGDGDPKVQGFTRNKMGGQKEWDAYKPPITIGWQPTCTCEENEPIPCTVLDPFMGSGTTALAGASLGRRVIGCELSPDYVKIMRRRLMSAKAQRELPV